MRLDITNLFQTYIKSTGSYFNILNEYVEKDYWLFLVLKEIFSHDGGFVFKGGTSLSKCYKIIKRFSEDIDISFDENSSKSSRKKIDGFHNVIESIEKTGLVIDNKDRLRRNGYFNQFVCPYKSVFDQTRIDNKVIIELAGQSPSFPVVTKQIQPLVGEYLVAIGRDDLVMKYDLNPITINVQSIERTFVDKLFAIFDYYLEKKCDKHSRHLYDISKLLELIKLDSELIPLIEIVRKYRSNSSVCYSSRNGVSLSLLLAAIVEDDVYKDDYELITQPLLYEDYPYQRCVNSLIKIQTFLKENNL